MARLCAVDLRPEHFGLDRIAQTRVASIEAVVTRSADGFDILFDISLAAFFARAVGMAETIRQTTPEAGGVRPPTGPSR
jgi:sarcosine oxidase subunit gamma